jgi:tyrosyl-tRNA synthetase
VRLDGSKISEVDWSVESPLDLEGRVLQVGKKKFIRFTHST